MKAFDMFGRDRDDGDAHGQCPVVGMDRENRGKARDAGAELPVIPGAAGEALLGRA
jgi:hypothetical protein